jgi:hypothetical protein
VYDAGAPEQEPGMNLKSILAAVAIAALPICAQAQTPAQPKQAPAPPQQQPPAAPKPTKAAAQKVVQIISKDKAKTKLYCDIAALSDQIDDAAQKKDEKKLEELSQKADEMGEKIGPEYISLMDGLQELDPESKEGKDIGGVLEGLDKLCAKP